jgi:hypothetical protein
MQDRGRELQNHHNDGEKDVSKGKYEPPHSTGDEFRNFINPFKSVESLTKIHEDNEAYNKGYTHAREQGR